MFGPKRLVYGSRKPLPGLDAVVADLRTMDEHLRENYGYAIRLSRPPHYVDKTKDGFSAYDAYALLNYQYLAASFDGAGWLPLASYEAEVEATYKPMERLLEADPDALCGHLKMLAELFGVCELVLSDIRQDLLLIQHSRFLLSRLTYI